MIKRTSRPANFFPMMVRIEGKMCLVVGGGKIAAEKIRALLTHGARVVVVSPQAVSAIRQHARKRNLEWKKRGFSPKDVAGSFLVIAATDSSASNAAVFHACQQHGVLCNAVDDPENCDFFYAAVVRRGPLEIAISTNGNSPALAARLRRELEKQFGLEWGAWVQKIGDIRRELLRQKGLSPQARRKKLLDLASTQSFNDFRRKSRNNKKRPR